MPDYNGRRYLANFDYRRLPQLSTDVLVIGTGVAGLRAAIEASSYGHVLLLTKAAPVDSSTWFAQGGIAAAVGPADAPGDHMDDTLRVGCGLCDVTAVRKLVSEAPARIRELVDWGAQFDSGDGHFLLGLEGGHGRPRILHSHGDATGAEIARALLEKVNSIPNILTFDNCYVVDLLTVDGRCRGALTHHPRFGLQLFWARQTILATGGIGRIYRETTNPAVSTGDGHAIAFRAGVKLRCMEMVQFHPTTLYVAGASRALISEAVRGEGAYLVDRSGYRFMPDYHPDLELAPRDVVSRAIIRQMVKTNTTHVFLDVRHIPADRFRKRFPGITGICDSFGIDVARDPIPVRPAAHYMIGGAKTDLAGRTGIDGLFVVGEVANTGVHGANRLASNSLLEGLVFGREAGLVAGESLASITEMNKPVPIEYTAPVSQRTQLDLPDIANALRSVMWRNVGIERDADHLVYTTNMISFWGRYIMDKVFDAPDDWQVQNMLTVGLLIARSALTRTESRGVHFRLDYPTADDACWRTNIVVSRGETDLVVETEAVSDSTEPARP